MPPLFVFAATSEEKLTHRMRQLARENKHNHDVVHWAESQQEALQVQLPNNLSPMEKNQMLSKLYYESIQKSGVHIIPGDKLSVHHQIANYAAANPVKVLAALAVPSVASIFYGRTGKEHLQFSVKLLHTRVFGQFATISILLGVMGFKDYMDKHGTFVTEAEVKERVEEMKQVRQGLLDRLEKDRQHQQEIQRQLKAAHDADSKENRKVKHIKQPVSA
jgi:hypothetical protein